MLWPLVSAVTLSAGPQLSAVKITCGELALQRHSTALFRVSLVPGNISAYICCSVRRAQTCACFFAWLAVAGWFCVVRFCFHDCMIVANSD